MEHALTGTAAEWIWLALALPLAGFVLNGTLSFIAPNRKRLVSFIGVATLLGALGVSVLGYQALAASHAEEAFVLTLWSWMPVGSLSVDFAIQVDQLSIAMLLVVTGVGSLIHIFSVRYMHDDKGYARYFAYLNLFVFFMLMLVLGSNFPVMFIGWEGVGLCSYLLIGFWFSDKANADAGKKAFIVNRIGDFGFLLAMFLLFRHVGSLDFATVFARAPELLAAGGTVVTAITLLFFLGCAGKSAQIPLYVWLPDAMAGPTPVSALIHAATMVTAGVYLVARTNILFAMAPVSAAVVAGVGALTALFAATIALKQWDIKKILAYSTISQLGYMFIGVGTGAVAAGIFHLVTHAFFKALLFLGAGSVIHAMHHAYHHTGNHDDPQDVRNMGGLRSAMPWTFVLMWIATLAIAGVPPFSGFFSKDEILAAAFARAGHEPLWYLFWGMGILAAAFTAFYITRLMIYTFHGKNRTGEEERKHLREAPWVMTGPLVVLGILSLAGGLLNLPAFLPQAEKLHHWLEPVTHAADAWLPNLRLEHATEYVLIGVAVAIALAGIIVAFGVLKPGALTRAAEAPAEVGLSRVLANKYYVDELYDSVVVRPCLWLSRRVLWRVVDVMTIDGAGVNGSAWVSRGLGAIGSALQTGRLGVYVGVFVIGAMVVLWAVGG